MKRSRTVFHNGVLVLPHQLAEGGLLIEEGRIRALWVQPRPLPDADETIDLNGDYLAPGFIDLHLHGARGVDLMSAGATDLEMLAQYLLGQGVTRFLPTTVPSPTEAYVRAVSIVAEIMRGSGEGRPAARPEGIHFEGPFVNPACSGALRPGYLRTFRSTSDLEPFLAKPIRAAGGAVMMTLAPEVDGGLDLISALRRQEVTVAIGHSRASLEICGTACGLGASHMTHFPNALPPLHHRQPGPVGFGLRRRDVTVDLIADGVHLDREMVALIHQCKGTAGIGLISDAVSACGMGDGDYEIWGERIGVRDGRTSNAEGHLAGSVITQLDAVANLARWGYPLIEISRMASGVPAGILGRADDLGSIAVGKRADLVALAADLRVKLAVMDGVVARFAD